MRGHSFQIGANAAFWTPKAQDGTNVFRARYFGRWTIAFFPDAEPDVLLSPAAMTNDKLRRQASPTRRQLSHARASHLARAQNARASVIYLAASHLPDRYGRRCG